MGGGAMSMEGAKNDSIHTVWIKGTNGTLHPQKITVGVTDEINFEVVNGLTEGDEVVTSMTLAGGPTLNGKKSTSFFKPPGSEKRTPTTNTQRGGPQ
jgi:HlyD family secretion protein